MYIDDILVIDSDQEYVNTLIYNLNKSFALNDRGQINYFLGIQVSTLPNGYIHLSQREYVINVLSRTKIQYAKSVNTPMTNGQKLSCL